MCGIVGIMDDRGRTVDQALLGRMCAAIRHRGPDDQGITVFPLNGLPNGLRATAGLGSRRLSIIDVAGGHQPISNEDRKVWVVLNGEIYNFQQLRRQLEAQGHRFATRSDTEVLVHLYEEEGEEFVRRLDGMFALALWDDANQRLVLARDRVGKKPLFYAERDGRLVFASELQALLRDPALRRELDPAALQYYLSFMTIPAPLSIYRGIAKLPPAHLLVRDRRGTSVRRYWRLDYQRKASLSEGEAVERLQALLQEAVAKRMLSDVPIGAFLSGGVDSSAVVALMSRLSDKPVKTFSIGFEESSHDELNHARRIAQRFNCDHHEFIVKPDAAEVLPLLVRHFGEPYADSSAIPSYYLARMTREHVTVALNGDGGDEAFAGYRRHLANRMAESWQRGPNGLRHAVGAMGRRVFPAHGTGPAWITNVGRFLEVSALPRAARYRAWAGVVGGELATAYASDVEGMREGNGLFESLWAEVASLDSVDAALSVDTNFYLPTDLLPKVDITSMANSVEARSPFLDTQVLEFAAALPSRLKLRGRTAKYILKQALRGIVPSENLDRRKQGFAVPIAQWLRTNLRPMVEETVLHSRLVQRGLLQRGVVERLTQAHFSGKRNYGHHVWALLMLELWYREFIEA